MVFEHLVMKTLNARFVRKFWFLFTVLSMSVCLKYWVTNFKRSLDPKGHISSNSSVKEPLAVQTTLKKICFVAFWEDIVIKNILDT